MSEPMRSTGFRLPDGTIVEEMYDPRAHEGAFAVRYSDGRLAVSQQSFTVGDREVVPLQDSLVESGAVVLPGDVGEVGSPACLLEEVRCFLNRYVDLPDPHDYVAATYVLFTWIHDAFAALPYLHLVGESDSGKSRGLLAVGHLCFRSAFATGSITPAVIFRILERYRGTLVIDEADFGRAAAWTDIAKILNSGYQRGFPVIRMERSGKRIEPRAYHVFGPKVIATRTMFADDALVSRCLIVPMTTTRRRNIPLNVPLTFYDEALNLRNKLLAYRLRYLPDLEPELSYVTEDEEPRISQVLSPLRQIVPDERLLEGLDAAMHSAVHYARGATLAGAVVRTVFDIHAGNSTEPITMQAIAKALDKCADGPKTTAKKVGHVIRRELGLAGLLYRVPGRNVSALRWDNEEMARVARRYGIRRSTPATSTTSTKPARDSGGSVDVVGLEDASGATIDKNVALEEGDP